MPAPHVLMLRAPGTNCDQETGFAFERAGAVVRYAHIRQLLASPDLLAGHQIFCVPGGFSYGDDIASGRILGHQLRMQLADQLFAFRDAGKLMLGICNGFQVLMNTGLLDVKDPEGPVATLAWNDSARYEARWVRLAVDAGNCPFLQGIVGLELPVAHAEGKFMFRNEEVMTQLSLAGRLVLRYIDGVQATTATHKPTTPYPANPNGAEADVAGICDESGRVLGLMPHPERFLEPHHHPQWTRRRHTTCPPTTSPQPATGDGFRIFENAVRYFD